MKIEKESFGFTKNGRETFLYTFENEAGMKICATDLGATLASVFVPDKDGVLRDVVLGYDDAAGYEKGTEFLGATVGRNANRIGNARLLFPEKNIFLKKMRERITSTAASVRTIPASGMFRRLEAIQ